MTVLAEAYDLAMLDLDGVVYVGAEAVPQVPEHLAAATERGMRSAYVTNNASRPPEAVAGHLRDLGIPAEDDDVVTSAQAAAHLLAERLDGGSAVFVIGGTGLERALEAEDLCPVQDARAEPVAVVSGYDPDLRWRTVIDGAILVREGLLWVASNTDRTVPTPRGPGPGNGVLVGAVADYAGRQPLVAGKPEPHLFAETQRRVGGTNPLVVGDRLDTDIEGANRAGFDSLLVLTGVTGLRELVCAGEHERPTYLAPTLASLLAPLESVRVPVDQVEPSGWRGIVSGGELLIEGSGTALDWWRCVATTAWDHLDSTGVAVDVARLTPPHG